MCPCITMTAGRSLGVAAMMLFSEPAPADDKVAYRIESGAQEIAELFWLADTAAVCGWASDSESARFKQFCVRYLSAHLPETEKSALASMVAQPTFEMLVRHAAQEGATRNCGNAGWRNGWTAYKAAADENEDRY